jgi:type VI secretion system protein ImpM
VSGDVTPPEPPGEGKAGDPGVTLAFGFYGKLPARGDFVRVGLPRDFTDPWDAWLGSVIAGSRSLLGEAWLPAFLQAPVWRFTLPPGMCGTQAALGLLLPSVDRAGRYFPLTFAALSPHPIANGAGGAWLDTCEALGRAALEQDTPPEEIAAALGAPEPPKDTTEATGDAVWWSDGSAHMPPARLTLRSLPNAATYAAMLGAGVCQLRETKCRSTS